MAFRPSRADRGPDPTLDLRILTFALGAVLAVCGMMFDLVWLIWVALGVLVVGAVIGWIRNRRSMRAESQEESEP